MNTPASLIIAAALTGAGLAAAQPAEVRVRQPEPGRVDRDDDRRLYPDRQGMNRDERDMASRAGYAPILIPSDWIVGANVMGSTNEKVGDIADLILSPADGHIEYALVSSGGVLGIGDKLIVVPWRSFGWRADGRTLTLGTTKERLDAAPAFDKDQWSLIREPTVLNTIGEYFGDLGDGYDDEGNTRADAGRRRGTGGWDAAGRYQGLIAAGRDVTVRGTVRDMDDTSPISGMADARTIELAAVDGARTIVHLGPEWFLEHQPGLVRDGDVVEIRGTQIAIDDKSAVVANTISGPGGMVRLRDDQRKPVWDLTFGRSADSSADRRVGETVRRDELRDGDVRGDDRLRDGTQRKDAGVITDRNERRDDGMSRAGALVKASTLKGENLVDVAGDKIGDIDSIVFDAESGRVAFVVATVGGFLGIGDAKYALPWNLFTVQADGKIVTQTLDKERLRAAPRLEGNDWADLRDDQFPRRVYTHFGYGDSWDTQWNRRTRDGRDWNNRDDSRRDDGR